MPAIVVAGMFVIFAGVLVGQIARLNLYALGSVFDLMAMLFQLFWMLGWSVGVLALGALTVFLLFFGESARLAGGLSLGCWASFHSAQPTRTPLALALSRRERGFQRQMSWLICVRTTANAG